MFGVNMVKKIKILEWILIMSILSVITFQSAYALENISIEPQVLTPDQKNIYLKYSFKYDKDVKNFTMVISSKDIVFDNTSITCPLIKKGTIFNGTVKGTVINITKKYYIPVSIKYIYNGNVYSVLKIYSVVRLSEMINNTSENEKILNKTIENKHISKVVGVINESNNDNISNKTNETLGNTSSSYNGEKNTANNEKTASPTTADKTTNTQPYKENVSKNIKNTEGNVQENTQNENNKDTKESDNNLISYIMYGIIGLVLGLVLAIIIVYLYKM